MKITFHGAARNVTGSKHLIELANGTKILLDCGLFQGMGPETDQLNRSLGFDAATVDFLVLSHAHIDHSGLIPLLIAQGFKGVIYGTRATKELCQILLLDSAKIQAADIKYKNKRLAQRGLPPEELLYDEEDVERAMEYFVSVDYQNETRLTDEVSLTFYDAGHIVGSTSVHLTTTENGKTTQLAFSGDVGQYGDLLLRSPQQFPQADYILLESTYGDKLHKDAQPTEDALLEIVHQTCVQKKGKLIIPAFSVGRTQELLYVLNGLELDGKLPKVKVYVDSPLSAKATKIVEKHQDNYNEEVLEVLQIDPEPFNFEGLHYIADAEESKSLNHKNEPCIIIASSGMAEAGRVKHHIANNIGDSKNTIMLSGYCEPNSLGGKLKNGAQQVSIYGDEYQVVAEVASLQSMSAHGDYEDLLQFLACQDAAKVKKLFLVHGDYDVQQVFAEKLKAKGYHNIEIPDRHQGFEI
jgi:metallo-beta-lactamase family protein